MTEELIVAGVLLAVTVGVSVEYYRQLRRARKEYEKARDAVEDVVLSFNRQLNREAERMDAVAYKVEAVARKYDKAVDGTVEAGKRVHDLEAKLSSIDQNRTEALARMDEVDKKVRDVVASQEALTAKVSSIEEQSRQLFMVPESKVEAVIPIKREKALAPLTETELSVLEMLASEGPKTAPEIKERIKLSREHTARLMKKLYEGGYLERDTGKTPFRYSVKKEMENLLKKKESEPKTA